MTDLSLCFIARADSVHTRRWVDPFVQRGDEVYVINTAAGPAQRPWPGVRLIDLPGVFNVRWLRYPVWTLYGGALIRRVRPDLVHAHNLSLAGWVGAATGYHPLVVTVWGSDILLHPSRSRIARKLAKWVLNEADAVTAPAQPLFDRAASFAGTPEKVHLIHWGVDCQVFAPTSTEDASRIDLGLPEDAQILFCPRAIQPLYDIETVLRASKRVIEAEPTAMLMLVEFNPRQDYRKTVDQWIQALDLEEHIRFVPRIDSRDRMAALYRSASVVISLPLSDSLSLTVLEAMACGTPVVVTDLPAYAGWVIEGETGYRVPPRDPRVAAGAVLSALKTEEARLQMGKRCRQLVCGRTSLERQVQEAIGLYNSLLSRS